MTKSAKAQKKPAKKPKGAAKDPKKSTRKVVLARSVTITRTDDGTMRVSYLPKRQRARKKE
jgi:hypothetical protein